MAIPIPQRRFVFILNPAAGKGRGSAQLVRLKHLLAEYDISAELFLTESEGHAARILAGLHLEPETVVVAVGGDGTVHEIGLALLEHPRVTLAVIPVGSGNDVAAQLGMPRDLRRAIGCILRGELVSWDVGVIGPHSFVNTVGFAFSAEVSEASRHTGPLTGLLRYGLAIARVWPRTRPLRLGLDGLEASGEHFATLLEIGVGDRCGGGFRLTALADPSDGLLDVCLIRGMPRWRMPLLLPKGHRGRHIGHPLVLYEQLSSFRLRVNADTLLHVDGEICVLPRGEHSVRTRARALQVIAAENAKLVAGAERGARQESS
jgi:YegS/Rv2252/BmrU family lipid kinase